MVICRIKKVGFWGAVVAILAGLSVVYLVMQARQAVSEEEKRK